ncbi:MAG: Ig-like domain-containing protein, partial [Firmicutes bacterium]|nr:Ig-like domain-containing protein [Bacillota bacterium]
MYNRIIFFLSIIFVLVLLTTALIGLGAEAVVDAPDDSIYVEPRNIAIYSCESKEIQAKLLDSFRKPLADTQFSIHAQKGYVNLDQFTTDQSGTVTFTYWAPEKGGEDRIVFDAGGKKVYILVNVTGMVTLTPVADEATPGKTIKIMGHVRKPVIGSVHLEAGSGELDDKDVTPDADGNFEFTWTAPDWTALQVDIVTRVKARNEAGVVQNYYDRVYIPVKEKKYKYSVEILAQQQTIDTGQALQLSAEGGTGRKKRDVTGEAAWLVLDDSGAAKVDAGGLVTGLKPGWSKIGAIWEGAFDEIDIYVVD